MARWGLRDEIMLEARDDGGVDLLDPLFERLERLDVDTVTRLDAGEAAALAGLDARFLRSNATADRMRRAAWYARLRPDPRPTAFARGAVTEACEAAAALRWSEGWRTSERWRRFVEAGRAGSEPLRLDDLVPASLVEAACASPLPLLPMRTRVVTAARAVVDAAAPRALGSIRALFDHPATRRVVGLALGRDLDHGALHLNLWRLEPGERMAVHPDGARYAATVVVGLNRGWNAADGGAIAFGSPGPDGLEVCSRWLPHAGDALIFAPGPGSWHAVETPNRPRWTLSGWWSWPEDPA